LVQRRCCFGGSQVFCCCRCCGGWFVSWWWLVAGSHILFWFWDGQCRGGEWLVVFIIIGVGLLLFVVVWNKLVVFLVQKDLKKGIISIIIVITVQHPTQLGRKTIFVTVFL
jgi:hypothetical protein